MMKVYVKANRIFVRGPTKECDSHRIEFGTGNGGYLYVDIDLVHMEKLRDMLSHKMLLSSFEKQTKRIRE